jgi:pimeloyl-ACP methyl ester carboxylesterase
MYCKIISIKEMILFLGDNRVITSPPDNARADSLYSTIISLFASQGISSRSVRTNEELDIQTMFSDKTVFLVGHSLGAFRLSQIYARLNNSNVQHLILFDPLIDIYKKNNF